LTQSGHNGHRSAIKVLTSASVSASPSFDELLIAQYF
jgi:hypothetical protein